MDGRNTRSEYEPTTRWGPLIIVGAVVLVLVVGIGLLMLIGSGSGEQAQSDQSASQSAPTTNPAVASGETTVALPAEDTEAEEGQASGSPGNGEDGSESGGSSEGEEASATPVSDEQGSDGGEESESGSGAEGGGARPDGAANAPGGFDPLNKNAKPGDLTETDRERVELVVSEFITSAYGYTGDDPTEYVRDVEANVVAPDFYDSPAGVDVTERTQKVNESGVRSSAKLESFEITKTEPERVMGTAYYATGGSYERNGELKGEQTSYSQEIRLVPDGEVYRVRAGSKPEETGG